MKSLKRLTSQAMEEIRSTDSVISPPTQTTVKVLPKTWIDQLFAKLYGRYGGSWLNNFQGEGALENGKREWAQALGGLSQHQIARGFKHCTNSLARNQAFAPNAQEFRKFCFDIDYEKWYFDAAHQATKPAEARQWNENRILFWAANNYGLQRIRVTPWEQARAGWTRVIDETAARQEELAAIPNPKPEQCLPSMTWEERQKKSRESYAKHRDGLVVLGLLK